MTKINIDDLTLGQIKQLTSIVNNNSNLNTEIKSNLFDRYVGQYVICRTRNEGINAGKVIDCDETGVILEDSRRLYHHKPADKTLSWYEGVALEGLSRDSKIGAEVEKVIVEDYSLTVCTEKSEKSIRSAKANEQS
jgi:hypothetical protein